VLLVSPDRSSRGLADPECSYPCVDTLVVVRRGRPRATAFGLDLVVLRAAPRTLARDERRKCSLTIGSCSLPSAIAEARMSSSATLAGRPSAGPAPGRSHLGESERRDAAPSPRRLHGCRSDELRASGDQQKQAHRMLGSCFGPREAGVRATGIADVVRPMVARLRWSGNLTLVGLKAGVDRVRSARRCPLTSRAQCSSPRNHADRSRCEVPTSPRPLCLTGGAGLGDWGSYVPCPGPRRARPLLLR
jgi:hypothetical protein